MWAAKSTRENVDKANEDRQISIPDLWNLKLCWFKYRCWVAHRKISVYFLQLFSSFCVVNYKVKSLTSQSFYCVYNMIDRRSGSVEWEMNVAWQASVLFGGLNGEQECNFRSPISREISVISILKRYRSASPKQWNRKSNIKI